MTNKHFEAITSKNEIARELRNNDAGDGLATVSIGWLRHNLEVIEQYIGESNQPSVKDIINDKTGDI